MPSDFNNGQVSKPSKEALNHQEEERARQRKRGASVLSNSSFQKNPIVESSFNTALENGEKLFGKNGGERRNYAYLSRLENLVSKFGNKLEKRLWDASVQRIRIIQPEDFTEAYWKETEQLYRDNGYGHTLKDWEKKAEMKNIQEMQINSLKAWSNYLGDENSPYPMWFKVYAWDGMTKMGSYNKEKRRYERRDQHTVAAYPDCDPEIISTIYGYINDFYNTPEHALYDEDGNRDKELEAIVASGNFSKLYSLAENEKSPIIPTPENPEDIHGEWVVYTPGDERAMARASRGTGWCTKNPSVARSYLTNANYGQIEYEEKDDRHNNDSQDSKAAFWVFHLYDPNNPGKLAQNGCLAILVDSNGNVTNEVRGLGEGEDIEDALIPTLEQKLKSLPGNENKLAEVLDRKKLITLDRKMQNGEDLTKEELEFLYEIHRPIQILDTYNGDDPRIKELREKYDIEYALNAGLNIDQLVSKMKSSCIAKNLNTLISNGANVNQLVSNMDSCDIVKNLNTIISHGANINQLVSELWAYDIVKNLNTLISNGANVNQLVSKLGSDDVAKNLDTLISHGANIDVNQLVSKLWASCIAENLDTLISPGADINQLIPKLFSSDIAENLDTLISHGADINQLIPKLYSSDIVENLDTLISHGAKIDMDKLVSELSPYEAWLYRDRLNSHGAKLNISS